MTNNQDDILASLVSLDQEGKKKKTKNNIMDNVIEKLAKEEKTTPVSVRLKESEINKLKKIAKKNGSKVSSVASQIISITLAEYLT